MRGSDKQQCDRTATVCLYALKALPMVEVAVVESHIATCAECQRELATLRPIIRSFAAWPIDVLRPSESLWGRIAQRIATEAGAKPLLPTTKHWSEPEWDTVAPGISCKVLATDATRDRVSMLVRLAPGIEYPPHRHAGVEELHLLHGELWINDRRLYPGDYSRSEPGTVDTRVWSETGCTCFLMTSTRDALR